MSPRRTIVATALAALVVLPVWAETRTDSGLWRAALALGDGDAEVAIKRGDEVGDFLHGIAHGFEVEADTVEFLLDIREYSLELNLGRVYDMLPAAEGDRHEIWVAGRSRGRDGYDLAVDEHAPKRPAMSFGELDGTFALTPRIAKGDKRYVMNQKADLSFDQIGDRQAVHTFVALLAEIEATAQSAPEGEVDKAVMVEVRRALPETAAFVESFTIIDSVGGITPGGLLAVDGSMIIDPDRLQKAGFKEAAKFLRRMRSLVEFEISIQDRDARNLVVFTAESDDSSLGMRFLTHEGTLVPFDHTGAYPGRAIEMGSVESLDLQMRLDGAVRYQGTRLSEREWIFPMTYRVKEDGTFAVATIDTMGRIELAGENALTGFLVAAADSAMGLEKHAMDFLQSVADGPDGNGSTFAISLARESDRYALHEELHTVVIDNGLIRFAARVVGGYFVPGDEVIADLTRMEQEFFGAMANDWAAARPGLREP